MRARPRLWLLPIPCLLACVAPDQACPYPSMPDSQVVELIPDLLPCRNEFPDAQTEVLEGTFEATVDGELIGPWRMVVDFPSTGEEVRLTGCVHGNYGSCWFGQVQFDIGEVIRDEPKTLQIGTTTTYDTFVALFRHDWELVDYDALDATDASGTATITRYVPADGEFAGTASFTTASTDRSTAADIELAFDLAWVP